MFDNAKKKLIHFKTSGNITEDFLAFKNKKCARLRAVIRLCFFYHLAGGAVCAAAGFLLGSERAATTAICAAIAAVIAFFAAGGEMTTKASLVVIDVILAAAGTIKGFLSAGNERILFWAYGLAAIVGSILAAAEMVAAHLREYLQEFADKIMSIEESAYERAYVEQRIEELRQADFNIKHTPENQIEVRAADDIRERRMPLSIPAPTSEMRELAKKLNAVLNGEPEEPSIVKVEIDISEIQNQRN